MKAITTIVAVGRLAERRVRQAGQPVPTEDVVRWLIESVGVQDDRARAGIRLAVIVARIETVTGDDQRPCLRIPDPREAAA